MSRYFENERLRLRSLSTLQTKLQGFFSEDFSHALEEKLLHIPSSRLLSVAFASLCASTLFSFSKRGQILSRIFAAGVPASMFLAVYSRLLKVEKQVEMNRPTMH